MKSALRNLFAAALLACSARALPALSTSMGPYGQGAAALGAGGAGVATAEGVDGLYWNPAARPDAGWSLDYDGALGGPVDSAQQGLAVRGPLDDGLDGGLLVGDQTFLQAGDFHEDKAALALSAALGDWVSVGTIQRLVLASPGGLMGWTMDAGASAAIPLAGSWHLDLGLAGSDLVSSLTWASGLVEQQPAVLRVGAALEPSPGTWLAFEEDQLQTLGVPGLDQWRLGAQAALFGERVELRGGATQAQYSDLYATFGLGVRLPSSARGLEVDYSMLVPVGTLVVGEKRQQVGLIWRFGGLAPAPALPAPRAALGRALTDSDRRLRYARIALSNGPEDAVDWSLDLRDRHGRLARVFSGLGPLPDGLDWDGKDGSGSPVQAEGLSYRLSVERAGGARLRGRGLLELALDDSGLAPGGDDLQIRTRALAAVLRPTVQLKGLDDPSVASADFDLRALPGAADATAWELRIVDASGRTVRSLRGAGHPPRSLRWQGNNDLGQEADSTLGTRFEIRVTGPDGRARLVAAAPLVESAGFAAQFAGVRAPAPVPDAKLEGTPAAGGLTYTFYFDENQAALTDSDKGMLAQAIAVIRARGLKGVAIDGYASGSEGPRDLTDPLSQGRADTLLKALLERGIVLDRATARGWADTRPAEPDNDPTLRVLNRRVVLRLESAP